MSIKKQILILSLHLSSLVLAMELPEETRGIKRSASPIQEEEIPMAESAREHTGEVAPVLPNPIELADLPNELIQPIAIALKSAEGATEMAKLYKAAENIRNLFLTNKQMAAMMDDPKVTNTLIRALANKYAGKNQVIAAIALATDAASKWIFRNRTNEKIRNDIITQLLFASAHDQSGVVKFLLNYLPKNSVILNGTLADGYTPLMVASRAGFLDIVDILIKEGAYVNMHPL